jgi:tetratricopeptide (TPR) repeat protein
VSGRGAGSLLLAVLLGALACGGAAPRIDLSGMEPAVRELIEQRRRAVDASPDARSWGELGDALLAHGLNREAAGCYARAVELADDPFEWLYLQALAAEPAAAIELLRRAAALRPDDALVELRIALALQNRGTHEQALAAFSKALELDPALQRAQRGVGQELLAAGRAEPAVTALERSVAMLRTDAAGWSALAQAYAAAGRPEDAGKAALSAGRGREHSGFGDPIWQRHVQDSGVSSSLRYQRALRALAENDTAAAREHVGAIQESRSDDADAHYLMGLIEGLEGNDREARRRFERAVESDPGHARSLLELAAMAEREGRLEEAVAWNRRALELTPHDPSVVLALARVQHRLGDVDGVLESLEKLVALQPDNVTYLLDLGDLYMHRQRWAEAERHFREAVRLSPGLKEARDRLDLLLERTRQP